MLGLIKTVVEDGLVAQPLTQRAPAYVKAIGDAVKALAWPALEQQTGATAAALKDAARAFAKSSRAVILVV